MSTITYPSGVTAPVSPLPVRKFTVEEYHQLLAAGTLKSGDPYELLDQVGVVLTAGLALQLVDDLALRSPGGVSPVQHGIVRVGDRDDA